MLFISVSFVVNAKHVRKARGTGSFGFRIVGRIV